MRRDTPLTSAWRLVPERLAPEAPERLGDAPASGLEISAAVPGCVHTDLLAAGLIDDPFLDRNEETLHWVGDSDWRYTARFEGISAGTGTGSGAGSGAGRGPGSGAGGEADERVDLVFDGLDTVAEVFLDGTVIARTRNMHRSHRIDVTGLLDPGEHELSVVFRAARAEALAVRDALGSRPNAYDEPFQYLRKMACNFGWDWGPTVVTAGIWKPVRIERWSTARLAAVRPHVSVIPAATEGTEADQVGVVTVDVDLERTARDVDVVVTARVGDQAVSATVPAGRTSTRLRLEVPGVDLWWPHDLGDQPLYDLTVGVTDPAAAVAGASDALDTWTRRIGFRTIEIRDGLDDDGRGFAFVVNGRDVFVRGANWIPDDAFPTRITREQLADRARQAIGANLNLLRVWGGGLYESDDFYEVCDELGLMVWQDFLFACAAYPEEEPLRSEVEAEARENVVRLMSHASLVLWCGNNENIWGYWDWDWKQDLEGRSWGWGYYTDLLPSVVRELDPGRAYIPGSPWSGSAELHPNDPSHGPMHIWTVWNDLDYTAYRDYRPRFVSEFGFQGPPSWSTLTRAVHDAPLLPDSPGVLSHQKAIDGNGKLARGMAPHLPEPRDTAEWHYLTQLNQANAIELGISHFRSLSPLCRGAIVWQLNDCWPVTSWALVDGDGRPKPVWYAVRRAFADRLLTLQPRDGRPAAILVNDSGSAWSGELTVSRRSLSGEVLASETTPVAVAPGASATVRLGPALLDAGDPTAELIVAEVGDERAVWLLCEDKDLALDPDALTVSVEPAPGGVVLVVTAPSLVRGLVVQADRIEPSAEVEDQAVTLLPGETRRLHVRTTAAADDPRWLAAPVLRTLNALAAADHEERADRGERGLGDELSA